VLFLSDWRRLRAWFLAVAVAVAGTQGLHLAGLINLGQSVYLASPLSWGGALVGGVMFGFGMTLAGGCGAKALVRLGGGNLKSLVVVLVMGLFAMMTLIGVFAPLRLGWEQATAVSVAGLNLGEPSLPAALAGLGLPAAAARAVPVALVGLGLAWWCLKDRAFRRSKPELLSGIVIGLLVPAGWAASGLLGSDPFEPVPLTSLSFAAPIGGALTYLMTSTGATLSFGVAATAGTVAGAFVAAALRRELRVEGFRDCAELVRHLVGAALMGSGGVLALGCTMGQGLSGMSTLSLASPLALAAIIAGGVLGLKRLEAGSFAAAAKALGRRRKPNSLPREGAEPSPVNAGSSH
jgi:uncharacterized membrane protein YedE/YeeE